MNNIISKLLIDEESRRNNIIKQRSNWIWHKIKLNKVIIYRISKHIEKINKNIKKPYNNYSDAQKALLKFAKMHSNTQNNLYKNNDIICLHNILKSISK